MMDKKNMSNVGDVMKIYGQMKAMVTYKREPITVSLHLIHPTSQFSSPNGFCVIFHSLPSFPSKSLNHTLFLAPSMMELGQDNLISNSAPDGTESQFGGSFVCHTVNHINSRGYWFGDNPLEFSVPLFMIQIFLMFIFTRFSCLILKPFGQPSFVSNILVSFQDFYLFYN